MKTQITERKYKIIEKDESGLIPDWAEEVIYHPNGIKGQIQYSRHEYESIGGIKKGLENLPDGNDRAGWAEIHKKQDNLNKKLFPTLAPEEVQKILKHLEDSL